MLFFQPNNTVKNWPWILLIPAAAMEALYVAVLLLRNLKERVVVFIPLVLTAGILYLISVHLLFRSPADETPRRAKRVLWLIFGAGLVFRATLFPLYPSLSDDLVRYRWDGKMQAAGYNPYLLAPVAPALAHLRDSTWPAVNGKHYVAVYGPLTESLFRWWYPVTRGLGSSYLSVLLMKVPMLAFDLGTALLLLRLLAALRLPAARVLVYWWAPVTVIEFAASGHNDSVAVFFLVLALLGLVAGEKAWAPAALALSTLSKLFAAFLWPVVLPRWIERRRWRDLLWPALCAAAAYWPFRDGLFNVVPGVSVYAGNWRNNDSLFGVFYAITGSQLGASAAYGATVAAVAGFLAGRSVAPLRAAFLIFGTVLMCASNVFPWYLSWILPLLAIYPNPAWLLLSVTIFLSYNVLIDYGALGVWHDNTLFQLLEYVPFYILLAATWLLGQRHPQPDRLAAYQQSADSADSREQSAKPV